jgi:hypothetical protein
MCVYLTRLRCGIISFLVLKVANQTFCAGDMEMIVDTCERRDSYQPKAEHESCRIDTLTVVTDLTHTL